jgi:hypothetical protein
MFCDSEFCAIAIARQQARPVFAGLYRVAIGRTENSQAADGDPRAPRRIPRFAWAHDWVSDPTLAAVFQTLPGASFIVNGAAPAKNSALTSAGAELRLAKRRFALRKAWISVRFPSD